MNSSKSSFINSTVKNVLLVAACASLVTSCKNFNPFRKKPEQSAVTGWNYNDKNMGGYQVERLEQHPHQENG